MSEYDRAIDFLVSQEGGSVHAESVKAYVKALTEESKDKTTKLRDANGKIRRLTEVAGAAEGDLEGTITALNKQVTDLTKERDDLKTKNEAETEELATLREEKTKRDKADKLATFANKINADIDAFTQLFGNTHMEIVGESLTVGEGDNRKSFDEYMETQPQWKKAALFSQSKGDGDDNSNEPTPKPQNSQTPLPSAPANDNKDKPTKKTSVGQTYLSTRFTGANFKK